MENPFRLSKHDKGHTCPVAFCSNPRAIGRNGKGKRYELQFCARCRTARWRALHPERNILCELRCRARRIHVPFRLTLADLRALKRWKKYIQGHLRRRQPWHIDRRSPARGYVAGNLKIIPAGENIGKGNRERQNKPKPLDNDDPF